MAPGDAAPPVRDGDAAPVDGRVLRGERTRAGIVDALLGLLEDGQLRPTAREIAERAGVSVRSIFQHFDDLEGLYGDLVRVQAGRVQPLVDALRTGGTLDDRIDALARQRAELFERITPMRHAIGSRVRHSAVLAGRVRELSDVLLDQVRNQFADELVGPDADAAVLALDNLCSFESWDRWRDHHELDAAAAEATLRRSIRLVLDGVAARRGGGDR